jgi:3-oxoacid CoA-transferase subunit A
MLGGFGLCGIPENSIAELVKKETTDLTYQIMLVLISVLAYYAQKTNQKMISSMLEKMLNLNANAGELDVELIPQGLWQNVVSSRNSCFYSCWLWN